MDIIGLIQVSYRDYSSIIDFWFNYIWLELTSEVILYISLALLATVLVGAYLFYKRYVQQKQDQLLRQKGTSVAGAGDMRTTLRFRKRDKMLFYGRRMLRKMKNVSGQVYGGQGRKRRAVMRFAKRILHLRNEHIPLQMKTVEPPAEYLQESMETKGGERLPPDALYMLQSIRVFGHFEKPIFLKLCKHTELLSMEPGDCLFKITDPDDSVYIVQTGHVNVYISNADGSILSLKSVRKGESVTSLLSFIDVLSGNPSFYKTVTAKAVEKSVVIRLPMQAFKEVFDENPDLMIRSIQVIMMRLQRVLFTALRNYLGLTSELVQNHMRLKRTQDGTAMQQTCILPKISPSHRFTNPSDVREHTLSDIVAPPDMLAGIGYDTSHLSGNIPHSFHQMAQHTDHDSHGSRAGNLSTRRCSEVQIESLPNDIKVACTSAVDCFLWELGLPEDDRAFLEPYVEVMEVESGHILITEGDSERVCIWYVMSGSLAVMQKAEAVRDLCDDVFIHLVLPGEIVGSLAVLTGEASSYTIKTSQLSTIGLIRLVNIYEIMRERPNIVLHLGNGVVRRLSPLVRQCDYALDWIFLESGRAVYRQDEPSDSTYIVLSGRMRSVVTQANGKKEIIGEYGKGDLVGIVEMITETGRTTTVMAVRDSELAKLPQGLFNAIKLRYPIVVSKLISLLSHRILGTMQTRAGTQAAPLDANPVTHKYSTVALVPLTEDVPLTAFSFELFHSLCAIGPTLRLTSEVIRSQFGVQIFEPSNDYRLSSWLAQQEDRNIITLYQCDFMLSDWTQRCMRQADVVLIVGLGERSSAVGKFEREIDRLAMRTQKELVLIYPDKTDIRPTNTLQWLNSRPWVTNHHHLQCSKRMFSRRSQYRINDLYSRVLMSEPNMHTDCSRLARWLTGNSVGVVLGGGGARGAAHIGMLKAIQEAGIPIDMVGGVSIGALMGALWCADRNTTTVTQKAREWSKKMTKWFLQLMDLTYPITSMFSGREFNKTIRDTLGDGSIEDLWIPYFTLTTDITASCHRIHTNGSLWRYVRSSMSLSGYMPPLCDPKDGHLLLDGGYVNNLPADVMHNLGAAHIIAIDVGSQDDTDLTNYGDDLSGWWLLYKKWNPFTSPVKVPDLPDIQSRLAYVSCVRQLEEVKNSDYCEYIRPPIDKYKTLAFGSFDEIRDVGYVYGKNYFEQMARANRLCRFNRWTNREPPKKGYHATLNEYTFVDLAQIVCKIPETVYYMERTRHRLQHNYLYSEYEDLDGYISEPSTYLPHKCKMKRTGTSLSLSENEMDSDMELDISLDLRQHGLPARSIATAHMGSTSLRSFVDSIENIGSSAAETPATEMHTADDAHTPATDAIEELPLDPSPAMPAPPPQTVNKSDERSAGQQNEERKQT